MYFNHCFYKAGTITNTEVNGKNYFTIPRKYSLCVILDTLYASRVLCCIFLTLFCGSCNWRLDRRTFEPFVCTMDLTGCITEPDGSIFFNCLSRPWNVII